MAQDLTERIQFILLFKKDHHKFSILIFLQDCLYFLHNIPINLFSLVYKERVLAVVRYRKTWQEDRHDSPTGHMPVIEMAMKQFGGYNVM